MSLHLEKEDGLVTSIVTDCIHSAVDIVETTDTLSKRVKRDNGIRE